MAIVLVNTGHVAGAGTNGDGDDAARASWELEFGYLFAGICGPDVDRGG